MLLGLLPQFLLDDFHIHREPSRLVNPSAFQIDTSCRPSPFDRLSQSRTTTATPPLVRLIGVIWLEHRRADCENTILERASLVPLLTLKRPRLGFDALIPNSGPLLLRNIAR